MPATNPIQDNNQDAWNTVDDIDNQDVDSTWDEADGLGSSQITTETGDEFQNASSQAPHVTLQQIRDLEQKVTAAAKDGGEDNDLLKILQEAEADEINAERSDMFTDALHQQDATKNHAEAGSLFEQASAKFSQAQTESDSVDDVTVKKDNAPSQVNSKTKVATFNQDPEVTLHANYDGTIQSNDITANKLTLYGATLHDSFVVTYDADSKQYLITVTGSDKKGKSAQQTFKVSDGQLDKIIFGSKNVDTSKLTQDQRDKIQVGLDATVDAKAKKLEIINSVQWPAGGIAPYVNFVNNFHSHAGGGGTLAEYIVKGSEGDGDGDGIDGAMKTGNWDNVIKTIQDYSSHTWNSGWTQYDDEYANDAIRKIMTGIYRASGATGENDPRFIGLLKKIPATVRSAMREAVTRNTDELHENHGDQWDSQKCADLLDLSINSETGEEESSTTNTDNSDGGVSDGTTASDPGNNTSNDQNSGDSNSQPGANTGAH